jgi:HD-GYP domain-containing protein (c-di-GMP phosphodiesterase class II)
MRLVLTRRLPSEARLARDVKHPQGARTPLLRAGTLLTEAYVEGLEREGIHAVYVDDRQSAGIEASDPLREETRQQATLAIGKLFASEHLAAGQPISDELVGEITQVASLIAHDICLSETALYAFVDLASADSYTHRHSLNVTVIGLLIAKKLFEERGWTDYKGRRRFEDIDQKLARLGLGLLLHDVGKLAVPKSILHKPGPLTAEEWEVMRQHPIAGEQILDCELVSPLVKGVVRSHHERWDGSGYPDRRVGALIFQFARVAAVADVFDAVTSDRVYQKGQPPHVAVAEVRRGRGTAFDPEVVDIFERVVAPYPPATDIVLRDGTTAVVVSAEPPCLHLPVVRLLHAPDGTPLPPNEIDLASRPELAPAVGEIVEIAAAA